MNSSASPTRRDSVPWLRVTAAAAAVVLLAIFAPVIWLAAAGGVGLVITGLVLALAYAVVQALPWMAQRLENRLLAARKSEARRNPIEQLQNELLRRAQRLRAFRDALVTVGGQVESIAQMVAERRHRDPQHELDRQEKALRRLQQFHAMNIARLQHAQAALDDFRSAIERKESEWRIALAIDEASALLDPRAAEALTQDLLTDTALRTVQERFNSVFAELDVQMCSLDAPTRTLLQPDSLSRMDAVQLTPLPEGVRS
jgi:hypothetical protein